jgi:hypothetical protein
MDRKRENMAGNATLYPNSSLYKTFEVAPEGFGYLFTVTDRDGPPTTFFLKEWAAADSTVSWFEYKGYSVQDTPLAFNPDEDFLADVLGI